MSRAPHLRAVPLWLAAAWWGSLTTVGFMVVPLLFAYLPSPAVAGSMAAHLFSVQSAVSTVCGTVLLLFFRAKSPLVPVDTARRATLFVVAGVLLAVLSEYAVAPHIVARDNLAFWHRVGTVLFVLQWLCSAVVLGRLAPNVPRRPA